MRLVQLADEYHLTTAEAVDLCMAAGIAAESSDTVLDADQVVTWRGLAEQQRSWKAQADEAKDRARAAKEEQKSRPSMFGPIPAAPWDQTGRSTESPVSIAPQARDPKSVDLDAMWQAEATSSAQVSLYAAASLALAVVSLIFPFVPAIIAILLARHARREIARSDNLTGDRLAQAALGICAIGILLWLGLLGAAAYSDHEHQSSGPSPDLQVNTATIQWNELKAGDCVRVPHADIAVANWQGVSCAAPHEGEVFAEIKTTGGAVFPGQGALYAASKEQCGIEFTKYVGRPYRESALKISAALPTPVNWNDNNDRTFACIVHEDGFSLINGSLAAANR